MLVREIKCKSLLNKSKLTDYCINPYVGCQHACKYCYAEYYTRKFTGHAEEWGEFVDVKINSPQILIKEIVRKRRGEVFLSSLTDPYQPLERKYKLTRKILEILLRYRFPISIQTKSSLVLRDLDLIEKFEEREVGLTIITLDEKVRKEFEPFSPTSKDRLKVLEVLKERGIKTYVFFGPVLPFLSDENLEETLNRFKEVADYIFVDKLNLKPGVWERVKEVLMEFDPKVLTKWRKIFFEGNNYYRRIKERISEICKRNKLRCVFCY